MYDEKDSDDKGDDDAIIKAAMKCLEDYQSRESDNIHRAQQAIEFRAGGQWPDAIKRDRENPNQSGGARPCPVLDKTNQYIRQIVNEERQNRAAIKVRPVDDGSDPKVAEIITGIIRNIEDQSEAIVAYTSAGEQAIDGGFGFFRLMADYCDPTSFYQDIKIKRIHNRFSVALGFHMESDGSDAREGLIWEDMARDAFEAEYPDAKSQFEGNDAWSSEDVCRIAEYFRVENKKSKLHMMSDGKSLSDKDYKQLKKEAEALGIIVPAPTKSRDTVIKTVKWYKITSDEVLERGELPGTYIPIVKVTGNEIIMPDGTIRLSGAVEGSMDAQRLHNYAHAGFIENVALAPKAPWVAPVDAIAGYENAYEQANKKNIAVLPYNHMDDAGNPIPTPQRTDPAGISPGWQQMLQNTEHGIEASFGMYGPSVGARSQEKSGIALQEQKEQGAIGNYHFPDNLSRAIQQCGRILLEWIPVYYDTARVARILGEDGTQETVKLDPSQAQPVMPEMDEFNQEVGKIYNLSLGKYDLTVSTGPSYTAKRQEAAANFNQILTSAPGLLNVIGDLYFKYQDFPGADTLAERMKATLIPAVQQLEQGKEQKLDPKMQAMQVQMQQAGEQLQMKAQQLTQIEQEMQQAQQGIQQEAAQVAQDMAKLEGMKAEIDAMRKILSSEQSRFASEVKLAEMQISHEAMMMKEQAGEGNEEAQVKAYEADQKYKAELAKAASAIIQAQIASGEKTEEAGEQPDRLEAVMEALNQAVQRMSGPKRVVFDGAGNPVGIEPVTETAH